MSELARQFAKKHNFDIAGNPKSERDWRMVLKEMKAGVNKDKVMDEFKSKAKTMMAKRHMKHVLADVKNHQRNRIHLEIPVERTDPPTVSQAKIQASLGNVNVNNYTIAFSVQVTTFIKDEDDDAERAVVDTTAETPINSREFLKKYEKRTAGALTGFLNRYMQKLLKSMQVVNKINLFLIKKVAMKRPLTPNFDGMTTNCLIGIVDKMVQSRKEYQKKLKPRLAQLNEKYFEQGCAEVAIDEICTAVQVNIHVVSILQKTWYHKHLGDNKRTILVCSHNGHATYLDDARDMTDYLVQGKTTKCTILETSVQKHFLESPKAIKFPIVIKDQLVAYYDYDGNLYKNRDIFFDEKDYLRNKDNPDLMNVFTLTSRYYKQLKQKYQLQDLYRDENLYHFVKCADLYSPPWCTDPDYAENGLAFDQTRAYMFYEKSEFYDHYQFPRMPTHFYKLDQTHKPLYQELLAKSGFAMVQNVRIPGDKKLQYLRKTHFIQNGGVYTTMRLFWLQSLGCTFDLTMIAFSNDKQKIDFHIKLTEWQSDNGMSSKLEECALMGRLIPNQNAVHTSLVHCKDENEFLQLRHQLGDRVLNVDFDLKIIFYSTETKKQLRGAYHVHAYILDYQAIEFATKAMSVPFNTILKTKVDCLVLAKPTRESVAKQLHEHSKGAWAIDAIMDWMDTMEHIPITELKPFKGWAGSTTPTLDAPYKWAGFHEEHIIKDCKTQHIDEVDFTHRMYKLQPDLYPLPLYTTEQGELTSTSVHRNTEVTAAAGNGKTYLLTQQLKHYDACMIVPTHALRVKFQEECPGMPCFTYQTAFNTQAKERGRAKNDDSVYLPERRPYSTYILDECSMICKGVMNDILTDKNAKNANIILIHDRAQLAPLTPDNSHWSDPKTRYFTYGKEYKARQWYQIRLTKQMRQTDPRFIEILTKMREMQDQPGSLPKMVELLKDRIISEEECKRLYRMDTKDILIASTKKEPNDEVGRWNKIFLKLAKPGELKLKYTKNYGKHVNNERVILQSEIGPTQKLAFASTCHVVQGLTFTDRLFISLSMLRPNCNFDPHLFYTAVSRLKMLDNLYLVKVD